MKVKIARKDIIDECNWNNPNFGIFASFLDGLMEEGFLIVEGEVVENIEKRKPTGKRK